MKEQGHSLFRWPDSSECLDPSEYNETMKPRVYLETTIPSYLTAWPSRDLVRAAHQQITRDWWNKRRTEFELYISQVVLRECQAGDATAAAERLKALQDLPLLEQTEAATQLGQALVDQVPLPERGSSGCPSCRHCGGSWNELLADLELHAHCQRDFARTDRVGLPRQRL